MDESRRSLTVKIRSFAKDIHDKYIVPPKTTDFALMFLPTEGLYAEVVQNAALFEELRDKYKVTAVGATTLSAFLASLQMGFKTLAIEQRSEEVWNTLRAVKAEFIHFGTMLDKAHKQLQTADKTLTDIVGRRTRAINRTLRGVEELTGPKAQLLGESEPDPEEENLHPLKRYERKDTQEAVLLFPKPNDTVMDMTDYAMFEGEEKIPDEKAFNRLLDTFEIFGNGMADSRFAAYKCIVLLDRRSI